MFMQRALFFPALLLASSLAYACGGASGTSIPDSARSGDPTLPAGGSGASGNDGTPSTGGDTSTSTNMGAADAGAGADAGAAATDGGGGGKDGGTGASDAGSKGVDSGACSDGPCEGEILATGQLDPEDVAVDDVNVYWTSKTGGTVATVAKTGGGVKVLANGQDTPRGIALDDTYVYFAN